MSSPSELNNTVTVLLDIQKAFDKDWVNGLLFKLIKLKLSPSLILLINSYLHNRTFRVKVNKKCSNTHSIITGVPQGSVLGPKLFNIFIHNISNYYKSNLALFADDTAIFSHSFFAPAANTICRNHILELNKYYEKWKITSNQAKTEQIVFSRKVTNNKKGFPLTVKNHVIKLSDTVRYLGVLVDKRLNFHSHIKNSLNKAYAPK